MGVDGVNLCFGGEVAVYHGAVGAGACTEDGFLFGKFEAGGVDGSAAFL